MNIEDGINLRFIVNEKLSDKEYNDILAFTNVKNVFKELDGNILCVVLKVDNKESINHLKLIIPLITNKKCEFKGLT